MRHHQPAGAMSFMDMVYMDPKPVGERKARVEGWLALHHRLCCGWMWIRGRLPRKRVRGCVWIWAWRTVSFFHDHRELYGRMDDVLIRAHRSDESREASSGHRWQSTAVNATSRTPTNATKACSTCPEHAEGRGDGTTAQPANVRCGGTDARRFDRGQAGSRAPDTCVAV